MAATTEIQFNLAPNFDAILAQWAEEYGFRFKGTDTGVALYQKGTGFLVAPMMLSVHKHGNHVHLQAWIRANLFIRVMSLFMLPAQMGIESGGFRAVAPRSIARKAINELLTRLGQKPIP